MLEFGYPKTVGLTVKSIGANTKSLEAKLKNSHPLSKMAIHHPKSMSKTHYRSKRKKNCEEKERA